jgi:hypothetical protein
MRFSGGDRDRRRKVEQQSAPTVPGLAASAVNARCARKRNFYTPYDPVPRIFVVDDESIIASTLAVILNMNGFSARAFTRPTEALAAAEEDPPTYCYRMWQFQNSPGLVLPFVSKRDIHAATFCSFLGRRGPRICLRTHATTGAFFPCW